MILKAYIQAWTDRVPMYSCQINWLNKHGQIWLKNQPFHLYKNCVNTEILWHLMHLTANKSKVSVYDEIISKVPWEPGIISSRQPRVVNPQKNLTSTSFSRKMISYTSNRDRCSSLWNKMHTVSMFILWQKPIRYFFNGTLWVLSDTSFIKSTKGITPQELNIFSNASSRNF